MRPPYGEATSSMDCIILVGNRENYREVADDNNKAFLKIGKRNILQIRIDELREVPEIDRLLLVGPKERLTTLISEVYPNGYPKPIRIFEQHQDLLENALEPITQTAHEQPADRYVLYLPSDLPLITAKEVREFIGLADMERFDFVTGLVTAKTLERYAPQGDQPGITMLCFHLSCNSYRPNNMHMVRPNAIHNIDYIRQLYAMRYQKKFINGLKLLYAVGTTSLGLRGIAYFGMMRLSLLFRSWNWTSFARVVEKSLNITKAEGGVSEVLGSRYSTVITSSGATTIDVDNEADYKTVCDRFEHWRALLDADEAVLPKTRNAQ